MQKELFTCEFDNNAQLLEKYWVEALQKEDIDWERNIFEQGGDSMQIAILYHIINEEKGIEIEIADLFLYPSIHSLAQFIAIKFS